ncbi:MAG: PAS domain S-box protein [Nitrospirae bacterium]|nr:PAS domain S-box protein [Nitrospirota bacterium]
MEIQPKSDSLLILMLVGLAAGIFVLDLSIPRGAAIGVLYVVPLFLSFRFSQRTRVLLFAAACTLLTILGAIYAPPGSDLTYVVANRLLSLLVIWTVVLRYVQRSRQHAWQQESEGRLSAILRSAMDAIITIDDDQRITLFNPAAEQMFRCSADEAIGQPIDRFIPERFRHAHREHIRRFGETKVTNRRMGALGSVIGLRADGEEFPAEASISQLDTARGKLYSVILRDITERKRAEEALRESEERFKAFMDNSPTVAFMKDEQGRYVYVNQPFERRFSKVSTEWLGKTDEELWPPETARQFRANDDVALAGEAPIECVETVPDPTGGLQHWLVLKFPVTDARGRRYLGGAAMEITERKRLEAQLRHTERLAELGTLASGMAHEIGTPMNVILGRAEYLMQRTQEPAMKKGLETIIAQVERITKIMNQLLTFARRRPTARQPMDIRKTIEDSLEVVQERFRRHNIHIETDFEDSMPLVYADPDQMSQVLLNLVINAVHAMPEGGTLRLGLGLAGGQARMTVADTGHGIPKEDLPKIFDPFFTTKEAGKGTGLGLTVVHGIMQEHGGSIEVESEPGRGTTFTLTLPIHQAP